MTKRDQLMITAFIQGAKWWEWENAHATMWQSDQARAYDEAMRKLSENSLGKLEKDFLMDKGES